MTRCEAKVQGVLLGNAAFSLASAIALVVAGAEVAAFLHPDLPAWMIRGTGAGLALFALRLIMMGNADQLDHRQVCLVIIADLAWVVLSIGALAIWAGEMSAMAIVLVGMIASIVAFFAVFQTGGLLKARRVQATRPV